MTDEYDNLQLETHPLNLLFFLKKVDDDEVMESMNACVRYIFDKQLENKMVLVKHIYAEDWVLSKLPEPFFMQSVTKISKWPPEDLKPIVIEENK